MHQTAFAIAAGLIAIAMGLSTFDRYLARRRSHELAWTVALAFFAIASFALAFGAQHGWTGPTFRTFYLFGAIDNVPVLALGSVLLAAKKNRVFYVFLTVLFCAFAAGVVVSTPFVNPLPVHDLAKGSEVFPALPRLLAALGSGIGATLIVVLAVRSAFIRRGKRFATANILIAVGTLITGASGLLQSVAGETDAFSITLALGISVIFAGFVLATAQPKSLAGGPKTV